MTLTGADRGGNTFSVSDHADVRAQPNNMNIAKEADRDTLKAGETVTFTFKGGYTGNLQYFTQNGAATDVTLVEDLTPFKDSFELVAYNPGRFDGYKGYSLNGNTLNRTKGSYTVTIPGSAPLSRALDTEARMVTLAEPIDLSALSGDELKVTWDFGDVSDLWVSNAGDLKDNWPSVTLRAKEDIHTQSFTNVATLSYDRIRTAHGKADIIIIAGGRLGKSATRDSADGGIVDGTINNGNIHERLQVGDIVTFTLEYANTSTVPEVYTAEEPLTLIDIMTTNGLAVYSSDVVFKHIHAEEGAGDNAVLLSPHVMEVTAEGIVSASAKRTEFKISGTLQPSDVIRIRYQVKIGEGFMNSVSDLLNRQDEYQNGLLNPETAGGNLSQVHNYVYTTDASGTRHYDETPYYYTPAGNRLYFSKAVKDIGHITAMPNSGGHDYLTINPNDYTTQLHQLGSSEQNFIKYVLVIHNDANSGENLVINSITDVLPPRVQPITDNTGGQQFILLNFWRTTMELTATTQGARILVRRMPQPSTQRGTWNRCFLPAPLPMPATERFRPASISQARAMPPSRSKCGIPRTARRWCSNPANTRRSVTVYASTGQRTPAITPTRQPWTSSPHPTAAAGSLPANPFRASL